MNNYRITGLISLAHFFSHFFFFVLPPLFPVIKSSLQVSYAELGFVIVVFNIASGLTQIPIGVLVDKFDAAWLLVIAVLVQSVSLIIIGLYPSYWTLMLIMVPAGIANSVYHPADYSILSRNISESVLGRAFSIHTVAGFSGSAVAPLLMVTLSRYIGWENAILSIGLVGIFVGLILLIKRTHLQNMETLEADKLSGAGEETSIFKTFSVILSLPILMGLLFWTFLSISHAGVSYFSVSAFDQMYDVPLSISSLALTVFLGFSAVGILIGGIVSDYTSRHDLVAIIGSLVAGLTIISIPMVGSHFFLIMIALGIAGFASGITAPSRDLLIRAATPKALIGTVFGFVSTGLNIGGIIGPIVFGLLLDTHHPAFVFVVAGIFQVAIIFTVVSIKSAKKKVF
ncbi:MAG: MFS transporter [Rhodospirillaceae bacterium]|nr:MFS transporter [Rhodospirillaceae bacterium]